MGIVHILADETVDSAIIRRLEQTDISLLTCQPRDEIYALYGHTAIRVRNEEQNEDFVVNYGVFDFRAKFFVVRFVFGITDYMMGICSYKDFCREWNTGIYEQRINMTTEEKMRFLQLLGVNAQPENLVYRYNYFYDNCATRARNIIFDAFGYGTDVEYTPLTSVQKGSVSFRQLIHSKNADHPWARFGNDILLGVGADVNTSHSERQFLPDVMRVDFDSAVVVYPDGRRKPLLASSEWIEKPGSTNHTSGTDPPFTPTLCAIVMACAILALCIYERFIAHRHIVWADRTILALYGIPGVILFLMLFSQHPTVRINLQILTFCPLWLALALPVRRFNCRWYAVIVLLALFFLGNILQQYAEGMNIMALGLSVMALNNVVKLKTTF